MSCDTYMMQDAKTLLANKRILMCGSSNMRGLYKDLVWLLEEGTLITQSALQRKNEVSHCGDERLSNGPLRNSRNYEEVRHYKGSSKNNNIDVRYQFLTRLNLPAFCATLRGMASEPPDVLIINSTLWDISRWGSDGVNQFKVNLDKTVKLMHEVKPPNCLVIWKTALPPSFTCRSGLITPEIQNLRSLLPFHMLEANKWAAERMRRAGFDILDVHYHLRFMQEFRCDDGIHYRPQAVRFMTNLFLTHLALSWNKVLPGNYPLDETILLRTANVVETKNAHKAAPVTPIPISLDNVIKVPAKVPPVGWNRPPIQGKRFHDKQPKRLQAKNNRQAFREVNNAKSPKWSNRNHQNRNWNQNHNYHNRQNHDNRWQAQYYHHNPWN